MIGILGGTFDPVHLGHLRLALELLQQGTVSEIRFIPCRQPVHKPAAIATPQQRLEMLRLAIADQPGFVVDEREIMRTTPSYTITTLRSLTEKFPRQTLGWIIGSDAAAHFTEWHEWAAILQHARLLVIPRATATPESLPPAIREQVQWQALTTLPIASHTIRAEIRAGRSARYWVTERVWQYIVENRLYDRPLDV